MACFVIIHGAWHGGWCFDIVAEKLRAAGHHVVAPDLPGMDGSEEELGATTLDQWAEFAAQHCRSMRAQHGGPVVLVGHSRGGIVISEAGEEAPEDIDALVYICAMMLPDGFSRSVFKEHEEPNPAFDALIAKTPGGNGTVIKGDNPGAVFAQLSPPDLVEGAMKRLVAEPYRPRATPLELTKGRWGSIPRTYIECIHDRTIPVSGQRLMQQLAPGTKVVTLEADHSPYFSRPDELTAALIAAIPEAPG